MPKMILVCKRTQRFQSAGFLFHVFCLCCVLEHKMFTVCMCFRYSAAAMSRNTCSSTVLLKNIWWSWAIQTCLCGVMPAMTTLTIRYSVWKKEGKKRWEVKVFSYLLLDFGWRICVRMSRFGISVSSLSLSLSLSLQLCVPNEGRCAWGGNDGVKFFSVHIITLCCVADNPPNEECGPLA